MMSGNYELLIPAIAVTLLLLALPITREGFRQRNAITSSAITSSAITSSASHQYSTSSSFLCHIWVVLSSIIALFVWATCDLHFHGIEVLLSVSSIAKEEEESNDACQGNSTVCGDPPSQIDAHSVDHHPSVDQVSMPLRNIAGWPPSFSERQ